MRKPDLFLLGAPKCGTTSLYDYLAQHPEVFMSALKEPHHFGADLTLHETWRVRDRADYLKLFEDAGDAVRVGEGSVWSLLSAEAPGEIVRFNPDARAIVMLRNPVDAAWSLHWQFVNSGNEDVLDFGAALDAQPDRARGERVPRSAHAPFGLQYTSVYDYPAQLERAFAAFGRDRVFVGLFDELRDDAPGLFARIVGFLELDEAFEPDFRVLNPVRRARNLRLRRLLKTFPRLRRLVGKLPGPVRAGAGRLASGASRGAPVARSPLTPAVVDRLAERFEPSVARLEALLDRDLGAWRAQWAARRAPAA